MTQTELVEILKSAAKIMDKPVKLSSGKTSDRYVDVKKVVLTQTGLRVIADNIIPIINKLGVKSIGGVESGSLTLVGVLVEKTGLPGFFVRKNRHGHGMGKQIEGNPASPAVIIEDVTTSGTNSLVAAKVVKKAGIEVAMVISVVDRDEGAAEAYARRNINFNTLCHSKELFT